MGSIYSSLALIAFTVGCGHHPGGDDNGPLDSSGVVQQCEGLACFQVDCSQKALPPTELTGTVYAPNGTLPLFGVNVYVPASDPGPLVDGATCSKCADGLQGGSLVSAVTDESGTFHLQNVPATTDVPLVIQVGKWRRQLKIANVAACESLPLAAVDTTLPKSTTDMTPATTGVDLPRIAISTGNADALECLLRKLGIADTEIATAGSPGRIHLYSDNAVAGKGRSKFKAGFAGGTGAFADSQDLWNPIAPHVGGSDKLSAYDIVILSCEGGQYPASKPQEAMNALKQYADLGGRVFISHWHNIWVSGEQNNLGHGIPDWQATSHFSFAGNPNPDTLTATIDEVSNPKGKSFATWMENVGGSPAMRDLLTVTQSRNTCDMVDTTKAERWVYLDPATSPTTAGQMNFQFTTPIDQAVDLRCGKVVFSDMHVSADSVGTQDYPGGCSTTALTAQEKALAFMFFDIASCVGALF